MRAPATILILGVLTAALLGLAWYLLPSEPPVPFAYPDAAPVAVPPPTTPVPPPAPAADAVRVAIELTPVAGVLVPAAGPTFTVPGVDPQQPPQVELLAGAPPGRPGRALLRLRLADGSVLVRAVHVAGDAAEAPVGAGVPLRGRVVDAQGKPVAKAKVWTGSLHDGGRVEVDSDEDGRFATTVPAGPGIPVVATRPGLATAATFVDRPAGVEAGETLLVLGAEAELFVQVQHAAEPSVDAVRVAVAPLQQGDTLAQQHPFFLQAVDGWFPVDAAGRVHLRGLPRGIAVRVSAQHPLAGVAVAETRLTRPRSELNVRLAVLGALQGRVLGADGGPVAGARITARARDRAVADGAADPVFLLPADVAARGVVWATSGADGGFVIGLPQAQSELVVTAPGRCGLRIDVARAQGRLARDLVLPDLPPPGQAPSLLVPAPDAAPWLLRLRPLHDAFVAVAGGQPYAATLQQPLLADLKVAVLRDGREGEVRRLTGIAVVGAFPLPAELLK